MRTTFLQVKFHLTFLSFFPFRFGAFYAYNSSTSTFEFYKGEELRRNDGERRPVEYPPTVHLVEETHPEIFSANGSHGFWASPGKICLKKETTFLLEYYTD